MSPLPPHGTGTSSTATSPVEVFEFVRAMHDFVPVAGSNTCLSFEAGQIIRTLNKDSSGWWDGELDGQRGWFPSNYVEVLPAEKAWAELGARDDAFKDAKGTLSDQTPPSSSGIAQRGRPRSSSGTQSFTSSNDLNGRVGPQHPPSALSNNGALESIQHAIALLQSAVAENRAAHFQPSTACVISSVRTVLSSTDCLTRESKVLKLHPSLVAERKRILTSLASLVDRARRASSPSLSNAEREQDTRKMLELAEVVEGNVQHFLGVARELGVRLLESMTTSPKAAEGDASNRRTFTAQREPDAKPPVDLRAARSMSDLNRKHRPKLRVQNSTMPAAPRGPISPAVRDSTSSTPSTPSLLTDNSSTHTSDNGPVTPGYNNLVIRSTAELVHTLSTIHDRLLSTIAAFIGHVHAHTRCSHSSSYAYLIDMTRETIDKVREVLVVVEAVSSHPELVLSKPSELGVLAGCRETLYVATTALVTAARAATSAPVSDEEDERRSLLGSATAVLRSGGACVAAVKLCVATRAGEVSPDFTLILPDLDRPSINPQDRSHLVVSPVEDAALAVEHEEAVKPGGKRGPHTLSMLGRKATSLSCLRDKYQTDTGIASVAEEDDEEDEQDYGAEAPDHLERLRNPVEIDSRRSSTALIRDSNGARRPQAHSRTSSRASSQHDSRVASVPMSRGDSSRTSQSATSTRSGTSHTSTNDTSPRSSLSTTGADATLSASSLEAPAIPSVPASVSSSSSSKSHPTPSSPSRPQPPSPSRTSTSSASKDNRPWFLERDYEAREISFNPDGHVTGGTLRCLIERMTLHDTTIDHTFANTFFLTFRMFTTPSELCKALFRRFDIAPPTARGPLTPDELKHWKDSKATPVRLRVYNLFKTWVELYWQPDADTVVVDLILEFCRGTLASSMTGAAQRLIDLVQKRALASAYASSRPTLSRARSTERLKIGRVADVADPYSAPAAPGSTRPVPVVTKGLLASLRTSSAKLTDVEPLELARQLTIMESRVYCRIQPDELLGQEFSKKGSNSVNVRAMSTLSTRLTGWIAETILNEQDARKRTSLIKYFIKLSDRCLALSNYNTLMAILCALNSSTISRLKKTWEGLPTKYRVLLETLRKATEHSRNYAEYRARIRNSVPPCLPFLGLFLTDLTFSFEGNPAERPSPVEPELRLINFDRYQKMSRIVGDLQRFQVPYALQEVPEIQTCLSRALNGLQHGGDVTSLYRQSLLVEPRDIAAHTPRIGTELFNWRA